MSVPLVDSSLAREEGATAVAANGAIAIAEAEPRSSKIKSIAKVVFDNLPALISVGYAFAQTAFATYLLCWLSVSVAFLAVVFDFFHCRRRLAAGLEAVFPKMITVTYFVMTAVVLGLLYGGVLKVDVLFITHGCIITAGLFVASLGSLIIGKPWIYAIAVEVMPLERLEQIRSTPQGLQVFKEIMTAMTILWTALFSVTFSLNLACTIWHMHGGSKGATSTTSTVASISLVFFALKCLQPRVIQATKDKATQRLVSSSGSHV